MPHQTLTQAKQSLLKEVMEMLNENMENIKMNHYELRDKTIITVMSEEEEEEQEMLDDFINNTIYRSYIPITYDDLIEWTKEEPLLITSIIAPCSPSPSTEESVLSILTNNIKNYLKRFVYMEVEGWLRNLSF